MGEATPQREPHRHRLNANAAVDEAHHRVSAAGFKYYVTEMVCWATGGPQKYTGRSMLESTRGLFRHVRARALWGLTFRTEMSAHKTAQTWNLFNDDLCPMPKNRTRML
jgi:hypothetical protein